MTSKTITASSGRTYEKLSNGFIMHWSSHEKSYETFIPLFETCANKIWTYTVYEYPEDTVIQNCNFGWGRYHHIKLTNSDGTPCTDYSKLSDADLDKISPMTSPREGETNPGYYIPWDINDGLTNTQCNNQFNTSEDVATVFCKNTVYDDIEGCLPNFQTLVRIFCDKDILYKNDKSEITDTFGNICNWSTWFGQHPCWSSTSYNTLLAWGIDGDGMIKIGKKTTSWFGVIPIVEIPVNN